MNKNGNRSFAGPVIMVDDDPKVLATYADLLRLSGFPEVVECADGETALTEIESRGGGAVVLDLGLQGMSGLEVLEALNQKHPDIPVIIVTGNSQLETAVECMRAGAFDYLVKPVSRDKLVNVLRNAMELQELRLEAGRLRQSLFSDELQHPHAFTGIVTADQDMVSVMHYIEAVGPSNNPVLITGETGVGKELVARSCHNVSARSGEFVAVNVAGLDEQLFADTLFGHSRGAYTGASSVREGLLAKAERGTLVLDEIGDLQYGSQLKLLRVLQEREYMPLGSDQTLPVHARIIATTNQPLAKLREPASFRQDLFYRLAVHHIHVPPLRQRPDDVLLLWRHFTRQQAELLKRPLPPETPELQKLLRHYSFPGNVRELESLAAEAVNTAIADQINLEVVRQRLIPDQNAAAPELITPDADSNTSPNAQNAAVSFGPKLPKLAEIKKMLIEEALRRSNGNKSQAANLIGTTRQTLNYW